MYGVKIKVKSIGEKPCGSGVKVGDTWKIVCDGKNLRLQGLDGACPELINAILPNCLIMAYDGKLGWEDTDGVACSCCPDPQSQVIVSMERISIE